MRKKITFFIIMLLLGFVVFAEGSEDVVDKVDGVDSSIEKSAKKDGKDVVVELPEVLEDKEVFKPEMIFPEKGLIMLDRKLNYRINIFPNPRRFLNARLYKGSMGTYRFVITMIDKSVKLREIELNTNRIFIDYMREKLNLFYKKEKKNAAQDQRVKRFKLNRKQPYILKSVARDKYIKDDMGLLAELMVASTAYSASWGASIPFIFKGKEAVENAYMASTFIGAGLGFFTPFLSFRHFNVSKGAAIGAELGGLRGSLDGFLLFSLFAGMDFNEVRARSMMGVFTAMGMTEYALGVYIADDMKISEENMRAITVYSFLGYISSLELMFLIGGDGERMFDNDTYWPRAFAGALLIGGTAGMIGGYYLAKNSHYTNGDAVVAGTVSAVTTGLPVALASFGKDVDPRVYSGLALAGTVGGAMLGHYIADKLDFLTWESFMVSLGTAGGALLGFGVAFLFNDGFYNDRAGYLTVPLAAGGAVGFTSIFLIFYKRALKRRVKNKNSSNFSFTINPYAFTSVSRKPQVGKKTASDPGLMEEYIDELPTNTMINLQYKF